jgi:streptogrisin C
VAEGSTPAADETVSYNGTAGYYRYQVHAYSGSGSYSLGYSNP